MHSIRTGGQESESDLADEKSAEEQENQESEESEEGGQRHWLGQRKQSKHCEHDVKDDLSETNDMCELLEKQKSEVTGRNGNYFFFLFFSSNCQTLY